MNRYILPIATALGLAGAAAAEPITITVPADLSSKEAKTAYVEGLTRKISTACHKETTRSVLTLHVQTACVKYATGEVVEQEPTGLFSAHIGQDAEKPALTIASR